MRIGRCLPNCGIPFLLPGTWHLPHPKIFASNCLGLPQSHEICSPTSSLFVHFVFCFPWSEQMCASASWDGLKTRNPIERMWNMWAYPASLMGTSLNRTSVTISVNISDTIVGCFKGLPLAKGSTYLFPSHACATSLGFVKGAKKAETWKHRSRNACTTLPRAA